MNKSLLSNIVIFATGAAIGSVVTWKLIEYKYKKIADEEIASVKEVYSRKYGTPEDRSGDVMVPSQYDNQGDITEYAAMLNDLGYTGKSDGEGGAEDMDDIEDVDIHEIYVISPEDFGDKHGYDTESWSYYADGVVTDEYGEVQTTSDIANHIGRDFYKHYGEYEDDSVHIRNDVYECDYEVLKDLRNYYDVYPHAMED